MSDIGNTAPAADTGGGQTAPAAPVSNGLSTGSAPATPPGDLFAEPTPEQAVFDRGYVERLRQEGARYRTEHKTAADALAGYEQVFGGYDPEDRQVWLDLARTWATDPGQAAGVMQQIAQAVLNQGEGTAAAPDAAVPSEAGDGLGELTPQQVQQMIAEAIDGRDRAAAEQRAVEEVYSEIRAAGYDPSTKEGFMVLWLANNGGQGDIQAGIREMQAWRQSIVDDYVSGRANGHHPTPSPSGAVATTQEPIHDLRDARKAADAYIRAQMGASSG
jgi:hypothetical protein